VTFTALFKILDSDRKQDYKTSTEINITTTAVVLVVVVVVVVVVGIRGGAVG
jgi:hypothetical protein